MEIADWPAVRRLIQLARDEDLGSGDLSSSLLPDPAAPARFALIAKQPGVLAGQALAAAVLDAYDSSLAIEWLPGQADGTRWTQVPHRLAEITGPLAVALSAERVLLNFLQRLCGIATLTSRYVDAVAGTAARVLDTRKTTPGWRSLEKYAVRCGGGHNHRQGLFDAVLIKDNHLAGVPPPRLAAAVFDMLNTLASQGAKPTFVQVEADTLEQVEELFKVVGIDIILLDNFTPMQLAAARARRDELGLGGKVLLEASGGITLETIGAVAQTGVERISVGALTHAAIGLDLSLERL